MRRPLLTLLLLLAIVAGCSSSPFRRVFSSAGGDSAPPEPATEEAAYKEAEYGAEYGDGIIEAAPSTDEVMASMEEARVAHAEEASVQVPVTATRPRGIAGTSPGQPVEPPMVGEVGASTKASPNERASDRSSGRTASGEGEAGEGGGSGSGGTRVKELRPPGQRRPMVVYQGFLRLRVKRVRQTIDTVLSMTEKAGGYVESLGARVMIVRIPASDFEQVMDLFATLGHVLDRRVKAHDVTARFTDLSARLSVAEEARDRLLVLLEQVTDVKERLRIVQELKRLTEQIESISSTLATLQNLVDFFTITLQLEPVVEGEITRVHRSPFGWVRSLAPHHPTIGAGKEDVSIDLPQGFVQFEKDRVFRAQSADTTTLRLGYVRNEPAGDSGFWTRAVHHEMDGRDEARETEGVAGGLGYQVFRNKDIHPRYYLVAVRSEGDRVYVAEVFFPNQDAWVAHKEAVVEALATFKIR